MYSNIKQYHEIMQLLDTKMIRFKVTAVLKNKPEPFPLLLYKITKLGLASEVFSENLEGVVDWRMERVSSVLARIERKIEIEALTPSCS